MSRGFGSDNHATVHPDLISALLKANIGHEPSYGTDPYSENAIQEFKKIFGQDITVSFVFNGTAANVLALASLIESYQSVLCTDVSHIYNDECGAPEVIARTKLIPIKSKNGKFTVDELKKHFIRLGDQHYSQVAAISITQPTELGTVYSLDELHQIIDWAKKNHLKVHMDGARFTNAAYSLNCQMQDLITGVDCLSFGGTKNGFLFGEAVIHFQKKNERVKFLRKQFLNLPSKTRFIGAQFSQFLNDQLWFQIAQHSCQLANKLANELKQFQEVQITQPVQSNAVFCQFPQEWLKPLRKNKFFYIWDEHTKECRLMMSWDNTEDDLNDFISTIKDLQNEIPTSQLP